MLPDIKRRIASFTGFLCLALWASGATAQIHEYGALEQKADSLFSDAAGSQQLGDSTRVKDDIDQWFALEVRLAKAGSSRRAVVVCSIYRTGKTHFLIDNFDVQRFQLPPARAERECQALLREGAGQ